MKIAIDSKKRLDRLTEEFNQFFPFLTLKFFENDQFLKPLTPDGITVGKFRRSGEPVTLSIFPEMSVADLETIFLERFGLPVRVLRKAGNIWLKPIHSKSWSLQEQNKVGEIISIEINKQNNAL